MYRCMNFISYIRIFISNAYKLPAYTYSRGGKYDEVKSFVIVVLINVCYNNKEFVVKITFALNFKEM